MTNAVRGESLRKWPRVLGLALVPVPLVVLTISWWFTEPLETRGLPPALLRPSSSASSIEAVDIKPVEVLGSQPLEPAAAEIGHSEWPVEPMTGEAAKNFMLDYMLQLQASLASVDGYSALFTKQERLKGILSPETKINLKVRHKPFSVYMRFLNQEEGREIIYAEGRFEDQLVAHNGGLARRILPRMKLDPRSTLAMANNRHPVTEAGLSNLVDKLVNYRILDLDDKHATTTLDRFRDADDRLWFRAQHDHTEYRPNRPFARAVVLFDPETKLPRRFEGYDWPESLECSPPEALLLGEAYTYDNLNLDPNFSDFDFDPANPEYEFTRF